MVCALGCSCCVVLNGSTRTTSRVGSLRRVTRQKAKTQIEGSKQLTINFLSRLRHHADSKSSLTQDLIEKVQCFTNEKVVNRA